MCVGTKLPSRYVRDTVLIWVTNVFMEPRILSSGARAAALTLPPEDHYATLHDAQAVEEEEKPYPTKVAATQLRDVREMVDSTLEVKEQGSWCRLPMTCHDLFTSIAIC